MTTKTPQFRTRFQRERVSEKNLQPSETKQSFKDECDINHIIKQYSTTGVITHLNQRSENYSDVSDVEDYQASMNIIVAAREAFDSLPSVLRKRFENNPTNFLAFLNDPSNADEMERLGLGTIRKTSSEPSQAPVKAADEPAPKDAS